MFNIKSIAYNFLYQLFYEIYGIVHDFYLQSMFRLKKVSNLLTVPIRTTIRKMSSADSSPWQEEKGNTITELDKMLDVFWHTLHISNFECYSLNSFREVVKITFGRTKRKLLLWTEGISGIKRYSNMARSLHQKQKVTQ